MKTIKQEAATNVNLLTNLDKLRSTYYDQDVNTGLTVVFPAFEIYAYEYNLFVLMANSTKVDFQTEWTQKPDYVSYSYYGTTTYWPIILYTNQINCREDFKNLDVILVPTYDTILEVIKYRVPVTDITSISSESNTSDLKYYTSYPLDDSYLEEKRAQEELDEKSAWEDATVEGTVPVYDLDGGTFV